MLKRIHYTSCPCCLSANIGKVLTAKDYTVSKEAFEIWHCADCSFRFTQDVPSQEDIGPYYQSENYISHSNTKKGLVNSLYHIVRKRTLQSKKRLVFNSTGMHKGNILDVGAGTGAFLHIMQEAGWEIRGLEPDAGARAVAQKEFGLQLSRSETLFSLASGTYDVISLWHVLEHVHSLDEYMQQFSRLLKPSGKLLIAVPNYTSSDARAYGPHWAAWDVPRHLYHFSPSAFKVLAERFGLNLQAIMPMWYDSFYVSMLSEQYRNGKGNIIGAVWNGFRSNLKALVDRERCSSVIYVVSK
jgi:SAM-dependent methyltransferase